MLEDLLGMIVILICLVSKGLAMHIPAKGAAEHCVMTYLVFTLFSLYSSSSTCHIEKYLN